MNAITLGGFIILYLVVSQAVAAFIVTETNPTILVGDCEEVDLQGDNQTTCQSIDGPTFIETVQDVSVSGFDGAPTWFNNLWVGIHGILLSIAVILIVSFFIGLFFGGSG